MEYDGRLEAVPWLFGIALESAQRQGRTIVLTGFADAFGGRRRSPSRSWGDGIHGRVGLGWGSSHGGALVMVAVALGPLVACVLKSSEATGMREDGAVRVGRLRGWL